MLLAALPMHQHNRALNLIPRLLLAFSTLVTLNVFVNVTIGIGEVIQSEKASARVVSWGDISVFIYLSYSVKSIFCYLLCANLLNCFQSNARFIQKKWFAANFYHYSVVF